MLFASSTSLRVYYIRRNAWYLHILTQGTLYREFPSLCGVATVIAPSASLCYDQFCILLTLSRRFSRSFSTRGPSLVRPRDPVKPLRYFSLFLPNRKEGREGKMSRRARPFTRSILWFCVLVVLEGSFLLSRVFPSFFFSAHIYIYIYTLSFRSADNKKCTRETHLALTLDLVCAEPPRRPTFCAREIVPTSHQRRDNSR